MAINPIAPSVQQQVPNRVAAEKPSPAEPKDQVTIGCPYMHRRPSTTEFSKQLGLEFQAQGGLLHRSDRWRDVGIEKAVELAVDHKNLRVCSQGGEWRPVSSIEELQQMVAQVELETRQQRLSETAELTAIKTASAMSGCPFAAFFGVGTSDSDISQATKTVGKASFLREAIRHYDAPIKFFQETQAKYGDSFEVDIPGKDRLLFDTRPEILKEALKNTDTGEDNWSKSALAGHGASKLMGDKNMFLSGGEDWKNISSLMKPNFAGATMLGETMHAKLGDIFDEHLADLKARVDAAPGGKLEVDPRHEMQRPVLDVAMQVFLGTKMTKQELTELQDAFGTQMKALNLETANPTNVSLSKLPGGGNLKKAYQKLESIADRVIADRKKLMADGQTPPADFLTSIIQGTDVETGKPFDDLRLRHEVISLMEAGHETTATLMGWGITMLGRNPEELKKMQAEIDQKIGQTPVNKDNLKTLDQPKNVMLETLRMYPPFFVFMREAKADIKLQSPQGETIVPKGTTLVSNLYTLQRDEATFGVEATGFPANEFHADRFKEGEEKALGSGDLMSFGVGRRSCIGQALGKLETQMMFTKMGQMFDIESATNDPINMASDLSIHPTNGNVVLSARKCPMMAQQPKNDQPTP
jgi:cytochrome P450